MTLEGCINIYRIYINTLVNYVDICNNECYVYTTENDTSTPSPSPIHVHKLEYDGISCSSKVYALSQTCTHTHMYT